MSTDTTIKKIDSHYAPMGDLKQKYLASGKSLSMRLWQKEEPNQEKAFHTRPYETVGYVIAGKAKLHIGDQTAVLKPGDSWVVPRDAEHRYEILEPFTAVEATHPPAHVAGRDQA